MTQPFVESVEDFIWGKVDENAYLRRVVEDRNVDIQSLSKRVESIKSDLYIQLRKGVEENYPKLLEQVGAIESLDRMQAGFDDEMRTVDQKAKYVQAFFSNSFEQLKSDSSALEKLTSLNRVLEDALRCEELVETWKKNEHDLLTRAECVSELKLLCSENPTFGSILWVKDGFLKQVPTITSQTSSTAITELEQALQSLSVPSVNSALKALSHLFDNESCTKEIRNIMDQAVQSMDALFLNLSAAKTSDGVSRQLPRIGNNLHTYLEQFQLLGVENALYFSNKVATVMRSRMPADAEYTMRLVQTISKCLLPHSEAMVKPIKDALGPLKTAILSQSLARLFALVNDTFINDESKGPVIVEKLNGAMKAEISYFYWDNELQKLVEGNISKTLQMISAKVEEQITCKPEALHLSGRVSRVQAGNYQLLNVAHAFRKQWPLYSDCLRAIIDVQMKLIVDTMKQVVTSVLHSMHDEDLQKDLGKAPCSLYMGELCDHLKVFRTHINHVEPLAESLEALPSFINFVIEQFFLHFTLTRPFSEEARTRFLKDFQYLTKGLNTLNCKSSKYLNLQKTLAETIQSHGSDLYRLSKQVPHWLLALTAVADISLPAPYKSADWTKDEYINWFNQYSEFDRLQFLSNMTKAYEQSASNAKPEVTELRQFLDECLSALS